MQTGQPLIGKVQVAIGGKKKIVDAFERRAISLDQKRRDFAVHRIEQHDAVLVIGDEGAPVAMKFQPVGPAIVLGHKNENAFARYSENSPILDVDTPEIALSVERWSFEQGTHRRTERLARDPGVVLVGR